MTDIIHGRVVTYSYRRCRCQPCTNALRLYEKRRRLDLMAGITRTEPAAGSIRRARALSRMGWSAKTIGLHMGVQARHVQRLLGAEVDIVHTKTLEALRRAYDDLAMTVGPSSRSRMLAESKGWLPPLAWDDDTIDDPDATPYIGTEHYGASVEDIEWLIRTGGTWESISVRMGITKDAVEQALRRAGRTDLTARLTPEGATNPRGRVA